MTSSSERASCRHRGFTKAGSWGLDVGRNCQHDCRRRSILAQARCGCDGAFVNYGYDDLQHCQRRDARIRDSSKTVGQRQRARGCDGNDRGRRERLANFSIRVTGAGSATLNLNLGVAGAHLLGRRQLGATAGPDNFAAINVTGLARRRVFPPPQSMVVDGMPIALPRRRSISTTRKCSSKRTRAAMT